MMQNNEVRRYTILYWCFAVVCLLGLGALLYVVVKQIDGAYLATLIRQTENLDELKATGQLTYMPSDYDDTVKQAWRLLLGGVVLIYLVLATLGYMLGLRLYRVPIRAIEDISSRSKDLLENDHQVDESFDGYDGYVGRFYSIYGKMVSAIRQSREDERKEKIFLQDLIADISHQLKTPLATLTIYQDLLQNPDLSEEQRATMLKATGEQLNRMEWLVLSLLKLARLEAGSIVFEKKELPLLGTLKLAAQNVKMLSDAKYQRVQITCDENMIVSHDSEWLGEAITNILKNATEYAPEHGTIEVWAEQSPVTTMIYIKDYGIGISQEDSFKVFKRFYRAKSKVNENSIGIGLSLAKGIIEGQGGDITVESEKGKYTCFIITLYRFI